MYADGARAFVEVGPKRAQSSFVSASWRDATTLALYTNHPKKGDIGAIRRARRAVDEPGSGAGATRLRCAAPATAAHRPPSAPALSSGLLESHGDLRKAQAAARSTTTLLAVLCEKTGYDPDEIEPDFELEADLGSRHGQAGRDHRQRARLLPARARRRLPPGRLPHPRHPDRVRPRTTRSGRWRGHRRANLPSPSPRSRSPRSTAARCMTSCWRCCARRPAMTPTRSRATTSSRPTWASTRSSRPRSSPTCATSTSSSATKTSAWLTSPPWRG